MKIILAAIIFVSPHVERPLVREYARVIHALSQAYEIDPLLVVSIIRVESDFRSEQRSPTNDYGLMQIHVSKTNFAELLGHEKSLLHNPALNLYLGFRHLRMFKLWHNRKCGKDQHAWWRHYKWGFRRKFPNDNWATRVQGYHQQLIKRFRGDQWPQTNSKILTPPASQAWHLSSARSN